MKKIKNIHCPNCGAPVTTEVCPYCHVATGLDTKNVDMEYPVIDCKEAKIGFWNVIFPLIFALAFGGLGTTFLIIFLNMFSKNIKMVLVITIPLIIIGIIALVIALLPIIKTLIVKSKGEEIEAIVYGYMDDNLVINDNAAQIVKLLINTKDGQKFILFQLGDIKQPYKINSKIKLLAYKNMFMIIKDSETYF